ncbi:hypothetical protein [Massilia sp. 9I]|uniref:hypothetical protein n=1 Tax=Massilia sp. 9I TaxID=2653152 RepID=UPI0013567FCD|nr:hypothetical protein [Massilia sp. 9I]
MKSLTITGRLKSLPGVALGMSAFLAWAIVSGMQPENGIDASVYEFIISACAGAITVSFLPFLAGLGLGMSCFTIWTAITLNGIGFLGRMMLPVLFGWSLGVASIGFVLGTLIGSGARGLNDRIRKR